MNVTEVTSPVGNSIHKYFCAGTRTAFS